MEITPKGYHLNGGDITQIEVIQLEVWIKEGEVFQISYLYITLNYE